jgi:hypothetical protein
MKTRMKKLISIKSLPLLSLALIAGTTLITGNVWAKTETFPLPTVEFTYMGTPGPETRIWTTDGQIQHIRRLPYELNGVGDDLTITITGVCNHNRSLESLDGNFWGHDQSVEVTWGELTGTFRGTHSGKTIDWVGYSTHVYHGASGDFEGCKLMLDGIFDYDTKSGILEGTLMVPGAVDADALTASAEAATASAKKPAPQLDCTMDYWWVRENPPDPFPGHWEATISGDLNGHAVYPGGAMRIAGGTSHYGAAFEIYVDDTLGELLLAGEGHGSTTVRHGRDSIWRSNGTVTYAAPGWEDWLGRHVYQAGHFTWAEPGVPEAGSGIFRIN